MKIAYTLTEDSVEQMVLTVEPPLQRPEKKMVRYIRDSLNGNSENQSGHWVEIEALMMVGNEYVNVALNKPVYASAPQYGSEALSRVTNGVVATGEYAGLSEGGLQAVTIDLGDEYPIDYIRVWHYYGDSRRYNDNTLSVGTKVGDLDGKDPLDEIIWQYSGQAYVETAQGKRSKWIQAESVTEG